MRVTILLSTVLCMCGCYSSIDHPDSVVEPDAPAEPRVESSAGEGDSDGNGILDRDEGFMDTDGDTLPDAADPDNDGDGIEDEEEIGGTPWDPVDTDGDTLPDYRDLDSDGDSITDLQERPGHHDADGDTLPDRHDLDSDGDTIDDADEAGDANPATWPIDTDGDGRSDYRDTDSDDDGLDDAWERERCTDHLDPDTDDDGVPDIVEQVAGTDPCDGGSSPTLEGDFFFVLRFHEDPVPDMASLVFHSDVEMSMDVTVTPRSDPEDPVDATVLLDRLEARLEGGVGDPRDPSITCTAGLEVSDVDGDTVAETFVDLPAGTVACFDVFPARNERWSESRPELYRTFIDVVGEGASVLDTRTAYFFVPVDYYEATLMLPFIQTSW